MIKIGTWNLDAHWSATHDGVLRQEDCDVWLLTEVSECLRIQGYHHHFSQRRMTRGQHYAAILSRQPQTPLQDPHAASAAAVIDGITYCSSVLPWSTCARDTSSPWMGGSNIEEMFRSTTNELLENMSPAQLVWGGDWNQNLAGNWQYVGSRGARACIQHALRRFNLKALTANLPHRIDGSYTIDQIAVPENWDCHQAVRIETAKLSDHDAYTVEVSPSSSPAR